MRPGGSKNPPLPEGFQSTHSLRSATCHLQHGANHLPVSIHALLAECDHWPRAGPLVRRRFNPRTPCGVRLSTLCPQPPSVRFQSTHSLRSATDQPESINPSAGVSIHALLAECDRRARRHGEKTGGFNPRTPCGVRLKTSRSGSLAYQFQSTHSLRSATTRTISQATSLHVSIHALLAECDRGIRKSGLRARGFNPRTPCGVRLTCTDVTSN